MPSANNETRAFDNLLKLSALALLFQVVAQAIVGIALGLGYHATLADAYTSDGALRSNAVGAFGASFHYWGSALLIVHSGVHLIAMLATGAYRRWNLAWYASVGLLASSFLIQVTGNLLPMDRHGVQTAVVESGIAGSLPVVGSSIHQIVLGGKQFGQGTLNLWMFGHSWLFPFILLACASILVYGSSRNSVQVSRTAPLPKWPAGLPLLLLAILAISVSAPRGQAAGPEDFQSYGALVSWYTWPFHGLLSAAERINPGVGWLGVAVWPMLTLAFLLALPLLARRLTKTTVGSLAGVILAPYVICPIFFGGPIASLVGNRDPVQALASQTAAPADKPSNKPDAATILAGKNLFNSVGCSNCHGTDGANGDSGPDLTRVYLRHPDASYFLKYIHNPKSVDSASTMPSFPNLTDDQLGKLAAWLSTPREATPPSDSQAKPKA